MFSIRASFNLFGHKTRELDITPALGILFLALTFSLVGKTTMGV